MIPQEIKSILEKYQDTNKTEIQAINNNTQNIIRELKSVRKHLSQQLQEFTDSETVDDKEDELFQDLKVLKNYINGLEIIPHKILDIEPITPFTKNVHLVLISDDLCPVCNVKLIRHQIYYQRRISNRIKMRSYQDIDVLLVIIYSLLIMIWKVLILNRLILQLKNHLIK